MNNFYNQEQGHEALTIFNEAAQITFNYSVNVWEKQVDLMRQNVSRVSGAMAFQQWTSPEAVLNFQRQSGAAMLSEWQKFGAECYELTDSAGKNMSEVAEKGRNFAEQSIDDTATRLNIPGGKETVFPQAARQTAKTMGDVYQNGMDAAAQAMRSGVETVLAGQKVAGRQATVATAANGNGAKRKQGAKKR